MVQVHGIDSCSMLAVCMRVSGRVRVEARRRYEDLRFRDAEDEESWRPTLGASANHCHHHYHH